jgi:hypothetical protein
MHSETPGILTALALFLLLEPAVIYLNFKPWFLNPNHPTPPQPERYFKASIHSFLAMVATGAILTTFFSGLDYAHTPLIDWYGYNNICIVFDTKPSTYIARCIGSSSGTCSCATPLKTQDESCNCPILGLSSKPFPTPQTSSWLSSQPFSPFVLLSAPATICLPIPCPLWPSSWPFPSSLSCIACNSKRDRPYTSLPL